MKEKGGILEVGLVNSRIDDTHAASAQGLTPGNYVMLSVKDTGHGVNPENVDRHHFNSLIRNEYGLILTKHIFIKIIEEGAVMTVKEAVISFSQAEKIKSGIINF